MKNQLLVSTSIALGTMLVLVTASAGASEASGYVIDSQGSPIKSGAGLCWRTGYWTPAMATPECDPDLATIKAVVKTVAPAQKAAGKEQTRAVVASKPETLSLAADGLFVFGKSTLIAESMSRLDLLATRLRTGTFSKISIVGHTDRLGSRKRNQKLSTERAEAVKAFLVSKGADATKIVTVGKGSTEPKTARGECKGKKSSKLVACLQPDRRVEITVAP